MGNASRETTSESGPQAEKKSLFCLSSFHTSDHSHNSHEGLNGQISDKWILSDLLTAGRRLVAPRSCGRPADRFCATVTKMGEGDAKRRRVVCLCGGVAFVSPQATGKKSRETKRSLPDLLAAVRRLAAPRSRHRSASPSLSPDTKANNQSQRQDQRQ